MKFCDSCHSTYPGDFATCPRDQAPLRSVTELVPGLVLRGKYQIIEKLGAGGMGAVYRARHLAFDEVRAIKVISAHLLDDDVHLARFRAEAVLSRRLLHPNVVRVEDLDATDDGRPFIVMEYVEGDSLRRVLRVSGALALANAVEIARQACAALAAAHAIGVVHRDIKPDNMVIVAGPDGRDLVKVLDFGIAKVLEGFEGRTGALSTLTGLIVGTPQYLSPEQALAARDVVLDGRVDLYALGVVLYEMLTGGLPFHADSPMGLLMEHVQTPAMPPHLRAPERAIPVALSRLVMKALAKNRDERFASADEMGAALGALLPALPAAPPITSRAGQEPATLATPGAARATPAAGAAIATPATVRRDGAAPAVGSSARGSHATGPTAVRPARRAAPLVAPAAPAAETRASGWGAALLGLGAIALLGIGVVLTRPPAQPPATTLAAPLAATRPAAVAATDVAAPPQSTNDADIQAEVQRLFSSNSLLREARIETSVANGIVTLAGEAASPQLGALAATLASTVPGVSRVFNMVRVTERVSSPPATSEPALAVAQTQPPAPPAPTPDPDKDRARELMGQARELIDSGRHEEAARLFEEVLRLEPDNAQARQALENFRNHPPPPRPH